MTESTFRTKIYSVLKDNKIERFVGGKVKGKINTKRLYKINDSKKIFKQKQERKGKDYSITLLLDASGSMVNDKSKVAEAVTHISQALKKTDIPLSIYKFSDVVTLLKTFNEKFDAVQVKKLYTDTERYINCYECKQYDISRGNVKAGALCPLCNTQNIKDTGDGGTNDALALHVVGNAIHKAYKRNILIVITDGSGDNLENSVWHFGKTKLANLKNNRTVIKQLRKKHSDSILLGLSLKGDYTSDVYGKQYSAIIKSPIEIFTAVSKLLSKHVKRG